MLYRAIRAAGDFATDIAANYVVPERAKSSWMPYVRTGAMRLLASLEENRLDVAPDVLTLMEMGYAFSGATIQHLYGPKGLPAPIARRIIGAFAEACRTSVYIEVATKNGLYDAKLLGGEALDRYLLKDRANNTELMNKLGLKNKT